MSLFVHHCVLRLSICVQSFLQKQLGSGVTGFGFEERTTDVHAGFELREPRHDDDGDDDEDGEGGEL